MRFVPNYCVSYHGEFYNAGCVFEIDREDVEEMSRHGTVAEDAPSEAAPAVTDNHAEEVGNAAIENQAGESAPARKPGRPKKTDTECTEVRG